MSRQLETQDKQEMESEAPRTQSWSFMTTVRATSQMKESKALKTPSWRSPSTAGATPRIKSYRIRTPPSAGKSVPWGKSTLELDPKSDSSEHKDLYDRSNEHTALTLIILKTLDWPKTQNVL